MTLSRLVNPLGVVVRVDSATAESLTREGWTAADPVDTPHAVEDEQEGAHTEESGDDSSPVNVGEPAEEDSEDTAEDRTEPDDDDTGANAVSVVRPNRNASRGAWAAYAEACGIDAEGLTRAQLIEVTEPKE